MGRSRQRSASVANAMCRGLGRKTNAAVEECRKMNMFMDDFACALFVMFCKSSFGDVVQDFSRCRDTIVVPLLD